MTETATAETPAGSAPATEAAPEPKQFHDFTAEERRNYLKTFTPPKGTTPKAEESAPPPETAATTEGEKPTEESKPASESASETESQEKGEKGKHGTGTPAEQRVKDLLVERKRLESRVRELEEAAKQPPKAESAPPAAEPKALEAPKKPKLEDFKTYEEYDAAKDEYFEKLSEYKAKAAVEEDRKARAQAEVDRQVAQRLADAEKLYPNYREVAAPAMQKIGAEAHPIIKDFLGSSQYLAHIMYVIGKDTGELASFLDMAKADPFAAMRKIAVYEQLIKEELSKPRGGEAEGEDKTSKPETPKPPAKQITSAPPPPTEIGGKTQKAPDALEEALKTGDVAAYRRELNRQRRAGGRG